jgi:hypothetical protein
MALVNFNKPGQRLPAAAVGPAYQAGMTNINEFAPDQGMVNALLQTGSSTAPVQSNKEGMYRALQGVLGGYMKGRDKRDLQSQRDAYREAVMGAVAKGQGTAGTAAIPADISTTPTSILDNPSVPDVASLGLERIETPTGPGGQIIEKQAVAGTPGTPGGLQPMLDALRGDGTRDPRLQSALNETALMMQYGGLQDKAALEDKATARALTVSDQERVRSQEVEDRDLGYANALKLKGVGGPSATRPAANIQYFQQSQKLLENLEAARETGDVAKIEKAVEAVEAFETIMSKDPAVLEAQAAARLSGQNRVGRLNASIESGTSAAKAIPGVLRSIDLLKGLNLVDGAVPTGGISKVQQYLKQKFGVQSAPEGELSNLLGKAVLSQLRETFGSAFTEDEGKRLIELEGNYGKSPEANLRILANVLTMLERRYEVGVMAAETSGDTDAIYGMRKFREPLVDDGTTGTTSVDNQSLDTPVQLIGSEDEADAQYNNLDPGQLYTDTSGDQKRKPR